MIRVLLCRVMNTDMEGQLDTIQPVHTFEQEIPVPTGTVFRYQDTDYSHAYDVKTPEGFDIVYVEQRIEIIE